MLARAGRLRNPRRGSEAIATAPSMCRYVPRSGPRGFIASRDQRFSKTARTSFTNIASLAGRA